ncbi:MAG: hypothetical protein L6R35_003053 [Caloplaca aegaea]|nr:MAG: hypothetical protein L6R35_003053 [Caloplaca aegaea]
MLHPFQCLLYCTLATDGSPSFLLAASRASVHVFSTTDGTLLSTWRSTQNHAVDPELMKFLEKRAEDQDPSNRSTKRQKKASPDTGSDSSSAEIVTENGQSRTRKSNKAKISEPNVVNLVGTSDGQFVAVVTDEDKVNVQRLVLNHINHRYASSELLDHDPMDQKTVLAKYTKIAVCELSPAEVRSGEGELRRYIAVAVEGIPAIFLFNIADNGAMQQEAAISTEGNVIGITVSKNQDDIAYAIDTEHKQFSQSQLVDMDRRMPNASIGIMSYSAMTGNWEHNVDLQQAIHLATRDLSSHVHHNMGSKLKGHDSAGLLYGLENLRKRGQDE